MPPTPSKQTDVQVVPQLHIPFVGYQDDSDSEVTDRHVIFTGHVHLNLLIRLEMLSSSKTICSF